MEKERKSNMKEVAEEKLGPGIEELKQVIKQNKKILDLLDELGCPKTCKQIRKRKKFIKKAQENVDKYKQILEEL